MKAFYTLILALLSSTAYGQSKLPACMGSDVTRWTNCFGSWTWSDGEKYVGEWKDGKRNGQGIYDFENGDKYVGAYKDDKQHGQGTFFVADGNISLGEWEYGKPHGRFIEYYADKTIRRSGNYNDGILVASQYIDPQSFTNTTLIDVIKDLSKKTEFNKSITFDTAKKKCEGLGFKLATEDFGKCVLQLTK